MTTDAHQSLTLSIDAPQSRSFRYFTAHFQVGPSTSGKSQMLLRQCSVRLLIVDSFLSLIIPFLEVGELYGDESHGRGRKWFR